MEIVNGARHTVADFTTSLDKSGREHLVIVVKATYRIPDNGKMARPIIPPQPLATSDTFVGEPGLSATLYEVDFMPFKQKCDVLFDAYAHSPNGKPVKQLNVAVRVGAMTKTLHVRGDREWRKDLMSISVSSAQPFSHMPLHYGRAFGGSRPYSEWGESLADTHELNPIGTGYSKRLGVADVHRYPLPNLQVIGQTVTRPDGRYTPIALSILPRNALPRRNYGGTYDQHWRDEVFPFLPDDFDERYFQCAPEDQQISYPSGGEDVALINMMPGREEVHFKLPRLTNMPIKVLTKNLQVFTPTVVADTLYFEPDEGRFSVVWRTRVPIKRRIQEFRTITVGTVCKNWWAAKSMGLEGCSGCSERRSTETPPEDCPDADTDVEGKDS